MTNKYIGTGTFESTLLIRDYINDILETGQISYGKYSKQFEKDFAHLHNVRFGVLSNSGTSSLLVALQTLKELHGWQDGDEVIVPALTFVATVNVVLQAGLKPVLVDVESDYYGIDTEKISQAVTRHTRCIIPVHTFGQPCDMKALFDIINKPLFLPYFNSPKIKIVEDSCEAMFVYHHKRPVGSWSDIACFSTYVAHLITTGVGGIAITNNPDYAKTMRSYVNHGLAYDDLSSSKDNFQPMRTKRDFRFDRIGYSFRITELEAAIGLAQLETWQQMIKIRQDNAQYLIDNLQHLENKEFIQLPRTRPNTEHSWMMFPLVCLRADDRDKLTSFLESKNIGTRRMLPLTNQPVYKDWIRQDDFPVARWINENGFYIGSHQGLNQDDLDYMIECFEEFYG